MNRTAQREAILRELRALNSHQSADELYEIIRHKLPQISLGTVCRNLEQMSQEGIIRKLEIFGHQKRFDSDLSHHFHMRCQACGAVCNLPGDAFGTVEQESQNLLPQLKCIGYAFELRSYCPVCRSEHAEAAI